MAAYDNISLPGAPNIATAGNYAQLLQQGLSQIPQEYWKGQQQRYEQRQRDFFQNPDNMDLLTNAVRQFSGGDTDYAKLLTKIAQTGGTQTAQQLLPQIRQQPFLDQALRDLQGDSGQSGRPTVSGPAASNAAGSPASITGQFSQPARPTQIAQTEGGDTVNSLAAERGVDLNGFVAKYPAVGRLMNRDLTPGETDTVTKLMQAYKGGGGSQPMGNTMAPQRNPVPQSGLQDEGSVNQQVPNGAAGGSGPISPAPTSASGSLAGSPAAGRVTTPTSGATGMVPPGTNPLDYARALKLRAEGFRRRSKAMGIAGLPDKADEDQAAEYDKQANAIIEQLGKAGESTPEMKTAAAVGMNPLQFGAAQERAKLKEKSFDDISKSIEAQDVKARENDDDMRAMRGILNDPKLFVGPGHEFVDTLRGLMINAGLMDQNARLPNDALKKITSKALQSQIAEMQDAAKEVGGSAGRIMLAQIKIMQDSSQNPEMSHAGLRYLTELMERANIHTHEVAQLAREYKRTHGALDDGFYQVRANYYATHPIMNNQEIEHHQLLSAPHLPESLKTDRDGAARWARSQGLKPGDPIRVGGDMMNPVYKPSP